jgi:hypothetical protein
VAKYVDGTMSNPPAFETWLELCAGLVRQDSHGHPWCWWTKPGKSVVEVFADFQADDAVVIRVKGKTARYKGTEVSSLRDAGTLAT